MTFWAWRQRLAWCEQTIRLCSACLTWFPFSRPTSVKSRVFGRTKAPSLFFPCPPLLPATGPQTQASFCWGIPMATKPLTWGDDIKTCSFRGHRDTCYLRRWGGPGPGRRATCRHNHIQIHVVTNAHTFPHKHKQRVSVTFKWGLKLASAPLWTLIYLPITFQVVLVAFICYGKRKKRKSSMETKGWLLVLVYKFF